MLVGISSIACIGEESSVLTPSAVIFLLRDASKTPQDAYETPPRLFEDTQKLTSNLLYMQVWF